MKPVILDVDTGIDDALAISYAVRSAELDVLGITTCFGNVSVEEATRNTLQVLEHVEADIPVYPGADQPIFRKSLKPKSTHFHGEDGLGNTGLPAPKKSPASMHAVTYMIEQIKKYPEQLTIISVGPLTNLALTIMQEPEIARLVKRVVIMGGAVTVPGNNQMLAEANIYADPEAAQLVFQSGIPITLVGLDVTMQTRLSRDHVQNWREKGTRLGQLFADMAEVYMGAYKEYHDMDGCALHDPLAIAVAIDPSFVKTTPMYLQVELEGLYSVGRTVADRRERSKTPPNVDVCLQVDAERFLEHFIERVC